MLHRAVLTLLVLGMSAGRAGATVMPYFDEASLARNAESVVRGRVIALSVVEREGRLFTDSAILVLEVWKGKLRPGGKMLVRQPGGERGARGLAVAGAARFRPGEEVLLFSRWSEGRHVPVGLAQGKFSIFRGAAGKERGRRELSGIGFAGRDARGRPSITTAATPAEDRGIDELRAVVRAAGGAR